MLINLQMLALNVKLEFRQWEPIERTCDRHRVRAHIFENDDIVDSQFRQ